MLADARPRCFMVSLKVPQPSSFSSFIRRERIWRSRENIARALARSQASNLRGEDSDVRARARARFLSRDLSPFARQAFSIAALYLDWISARV